MGQKKFRPGSAESRHTASRERYSFGYIAILDFDPPAKDRSRRTPERETPLGCHRQQLARPLIQGCVFSESKSNLALSTKIPANNGG